MACLVIPIKMDGCRFASWMHRPFSVKHGGFWCGGEAGQLPLIIASKARRFLAWMKASGYCSLRAIPPHIGLLAEDIQNARARLDFD